MRKEIFDLTISRAELQGLAEKAAVARGVAFAHAARFGAAMLQHMATSRPVDDLLGMLAEPTRIVTLSKAIDDLVEAASIRPGPVAFNAFPGTLARSFLESMPCRVDIDEGPAGMTVRLMLGTAPTVSRVDTVQVPLQLWTALNAFGTDASTGDAPEIPRGSQLMDPG